ncbi:MAG TPA: gamma carbonic anhydrase family protein [Candidatus Lokiarchaeia archaeon]|nr:gamma carbonic anhydrase family protein [Candidatus Lokiarchaeia archaeon]
MPLVEYNGKSPRIAEHAYVSPNATLIGDVTVEDYSVIWPSAFLRAEYAPIYVGSYNTIFDGVVMFTRSQKNPIQIGNYCIIESGAVLFGAFLEDYVLISRNSLVFEGCSLGEGVILLNDSTVPSGMTLASRTILKGNPATVVREQSRNDMLKHKDRAEHFAELFIKVQAQLPNIQPYVLSLTDFMKILLGELKIGNQVETNAEVQQESSELSPEKPSEEVTKEPPDESLEEPEFDGDSPEG